MPTLFQRVDDLARHVAFVVLGEHGRGGKDTVGAQSSLGDHALPFTKQVGQDALIDDGEIDGTVGHAERDLVPVAVDDTPRFDQTADPHPAIDSYSLGLELARAVEKHE